MAEFPLEYTLTQDFLKRMKEKEIQQTSYVLSEVLDQVQYAKTIGYIQASKDAQELFIELRNQYFPEYRR